MTEKSNDKYLLGGLGIVAVGFLATVAVSLFGARRNYPEPENIDRKNNIENKADIDKKTEIKSTTPKEQGKEPSSATPSPVTTSTPPANENVPSFKEAIEWFDKGRDDNFDYDIDLMEDSWDHDIDPMDGSWIDKETQRREAAKSQGNLRQ